MAWNNKPEEILQPGLWKFYNRERYQICPEKLGKYKLFAHIICKKLLYARNWFFKKNPSDQNHFLTKW